MSGVRLARAYLGGMMERGWGRIVFISSESAINIPEDMLHYGFTKTAQLSPVARPRPSSLAAPASPSTPCCPGRRCRRGGELPRRRGGEDRPDGPTRSDSPSSRRRRPSSIIQRVATVEEVANMVVYACSKEASADDRCRAARRRRNRRVDHLSFVAMQPARCAAVLATHKGAPPPCIVVFSPSRLSARSPSPAPAWAAPADVSDADKAFVAKVSQGGMYEVALGKLAEDKGMAQDIKDQGKHRSARPRPRRHQTEVDRQRRRARFSRHAERRVPGAPRRVEGAVGRGFRQGLCRRHDQDPRCDGAAFAKEAKGGTNTDLKAFAAETHGIVERHLGELKAKGADAR